MWASYRGKVFVLSLGDLSLFEVRSPVYPRVPEALPFDVLFVYQASQIGLDRTQFHGLVVPLLEFPSYV